MEWEKVNIKTRTQSKTGCYVTVLLGEHGILWFSKELRAKHARYNLFRSANIFALQESEDGQIKVRNKAGGSVAASCGMVRLIREVYGLSPEKSHRLNAWRDGDMIIFGGEHHD